MVIGASTGVGRALAEALARQGMNVALVASDIEEISILSNDLAIRYQILVRSYVEDLSDYKFDPLQLFSKIHNEMGDVHYLFYPAGYVSDQDYGVISESDLERTILVNQLSAMKLVSSWLQNQGQGESEGEGQIQIQDQGQDQYQIPNKEQGRNGGLKTIVLFSSIAALVPRSRNMVYASAKAGLEYFALGVRHWLGDKNTILQVYALGYVDTGMSFGQKLLFPVVHPEEVANVVVKNLDKDFGKKYYPGYWFWIVTVLRQLPWMIYKKLKF